MQARPHAFTHSSDNKGIRTAGPRGDVSEAREKLPLPLLLAMTVGLGLEGAIPTAGTGGATLALLALALNSREDDDDDDDDDDDAVTPASISPLSEVASVKKG